MQSRLRFFPLLRSFSSFKGCTTVIRDAEGYRLSADLSKQLENLPNTEHTVSLKVLVYKVNGSVPPIQITSGDCSVEWLGKERKNMAAVNTEYYEYDGILVKIKSGTSFSLKFDKGVYVDDVYGVSVASASLESTARLKN